MDNSERVAFIRKGNELFNQGDYKNSLKIFLATDYKDGIIRVADYLYFDRHDKIGAVKLYKKAGHKKVLDDFVEKAAAIIRMYLSEDKWIPEAGNQETGVEVKEWKPVVLSIEEIANLKGDNTGNSINKPSGNDGKNNREQV